jgi:bifunctional N-acetylglucosamine-1-phosphate-uridyltransferase/glucosamine-1-phosphate-acetyltransferase GlmU-like protein
VLFAPDPVLDAAALSALAVVKSHPGTRELHQARRGGQRVLVVFGGDTPWLLTGTLQRLLRAHGDRTPSVEVLPTPEPPTAYHRAAVSGSAALWRSPVTAAS